MTNEKKNAPQSVEEQGPPPVAGDAPPENDPNIVGSLEVDELMALNSLRQQGNQLVTQLGNLELRKARVLGQVQAVEDRAQDILNKIAKRLGIPEEKTWQVTPDGKARMLDNVTPMTQEIAGTAADDVPGEDAPPLE